MKTLATLLLSTPLAHTHGTLDLKVAQQTAPLGIDEPFMGIRSENNTRSLPPAPTASPSRRAVTHAPSRVVSGALAGNPAR